jgi:hypothetical protein
MNAMAENMERALRKALRWARNVGLTFSASKTQVMWFHGKNKFCPAIDAPKIKMEGSNLEVEESVVYLGVRLDSKLLFREHFAEKLKKMKRMMMAFNMIVGKTWGVNPNHTKWLYERVCRPILTYACFVWAPRLLKYQYVEEEGRKAQRLALLLIAPVKGKTPTMGMEIIHDYPPLEIHLTGEVIKAAVRLANTEERVATHHRSNRGNHRSKARAILAESILTNLDGI